MSNEVAIFLDLDNLVIGAKQANLPFEVQLLVQAIEEETSGRVVLRQAYGAGRQSQGLLQALTEAGFEVQSATPLTSFSKNLADMQIVVNAMDTLVDGLDLGTYVLMSGDRDFTPLVQALRKRSKRVIGIGVRHTTSKSLAQLCDRYIYYEDLIRRESAPTAQLEALITAARDELLRDQNRVQASVFKQQMERLNGNMFQDASLASGSFSNLLRRYPQLVQLVQEDTTLYVMRPGAGDPESPLHQQYRTALKKRRLRVVPSAERFAILQQAILCLSEERDWVWGELNREIAAALAERPPLQVSKTLVNAMLLVAREAGVLHTLKGRTLPSAPVLLQVRGPRAFQEAVICCDSAYLQAILDLPLPFDLAETAVALYDSVAYAPYLQRVSKT